MFVTGNLSPQVIRWFCLLLAVSGFAIGLVSGFVWVGNEKSGEALYASSRGVVKENITRKIHPDKFREAQTRLLFRAGLGGVFCVLGFSFFKKLGE